MTEIATTPAAPDLREQSPEERKAALAQAVANEVRGGWHVQSQTDYQAVLVKGKRTSHGLHLFLSFITLGLCEAPGSGRSVNRQSRGQLGAKRRFRASR